MPRINSKTAQEILDEAVRCGVVFDLDADGMVTVMAAVEPPPWFRDWLGEHRTEIADLLRQEAIDEREARAPRWIH